MRTKVHRASFLVKFGTYFVSLLVPAMLASHLSQQKTWITKYELSKLHPLTWLNNSVEAAMWLERQLIDLGTSVPVGGEQAARDRRRQEKRERQRPGRPRPRFFER